MARLRLLSPAPAREPAPALVAPSVLPHLVARRFKCAGERRRPGDCEVFLLQSVYLRVMEHLASDTSRELGGLLLGVELEAAHGGKAVVILHALPAEHSEGTPVRLAMTERTWERFNEVTGGYEQSGLKLRRVGWYHSHPNIPIFLSSYDLDVCTVFPQPTHVALVADPVQDRGGVFVNGVGGYHPRHPQGFVELCDLRPESVVSWRNLSLLTDEAVKLPVPEGGSNGRLGPARSAGGLPLFPDAVGLNGTHAAATPATGVREGEDTPEELLRLLYRLCAALFAAVVIGILGWTRPVTVVEKPERPATTANTPVGPERK